MNHFVTNFFITKDSSLIRLSRKNGLEGYDFETSYWVKLCSQNTVRRGSLVSLYGKPVSLTEATNLVISRLDIDIGE